MPQVIVEPLKSKGIAVLLVFLLGPLGVFYASIFGGIVMTFVVPLITILLLLNGILGDGAGVLLLLLLPFYYLTCFIWAISAVSSHNWKMMNRAYFHNQYSPTSTIINVSSPSANTSRSQLFADLNAIGHLYKQKVISEEKYLKQKEEITKKLADSSPNEAFSYSSDSNSFQSISKQNNSTLLYILVPVIVVLLGIIIYDKGLIPTESVAHLFDPHRKDKEAIKNQIETVYFGIANGNYTAQGFGNGEGMPVYNLNLKSVVLMGLTPIANIFGKMELEPKNINIDKFIDDHNAKVQYDLFVRADNSSDSVHIKMIVKKIGGVWKLDGEKIGGIEKIKK